MKRINKAKIELNLNEYVILGGESEGLKYKIFYEGKEITDVVAIIRVNMEKE